MKATLKKSTKIKSNPTIISATKSILELNDYITLSDLINLICKLTGKSKASVTGTSFGSSNKFRSEEWFFKDYLYMPRNNKTPATIFKKSFLKMANSLNNTKPITISYNTEEKKQARKFIFENIVNIDNPIILTLAGEEGLDVEYLLKLNEKCIIDNVERNTIFLEKFKLLNLKSNNYNMDFGNFLKITKRHYHLINYDTIGYLCDYISKDLLLINNKKITDYLCLTIQDLKTLRNTGNFANTNREKYKHFDNQTFAYLSENMTNYDIISVYRYTQNKVGMIIFKFKLKN